jgi:hypothetical protein
VLCLRQVALVARELDPVVDDLCAALGVEVAFHDPGVKVFGLRNAVLPVGDAFLEVVSPVADDAPALRYLERRGGDAGYMVMLQTDAFDADRARALAQGIRVAWSATLPDIRGMHLHPADTGGALLSLDQPEPAEAWRWAGPEWRDHVRTERVQGIAGATLACRDPRATARRWSAFLDRPVAPEGEGFRMELDRGGALRFAGGAGPAVEGLAAFRVCAAEPEAVLRRADARGLPRVAGGVGFVCCGTRVEIA